MGKMYSVSFTDVAVTAQQDFFEINNGSTKLLSVHSIRLANSTDVGDAQAEGLSVTLVSGNTTSGSGGSAPTPTPLEPNQGASTFTAEANNTTKATIGTVLTYYAWAWIIQNPFIEQFTPEERVTVAPSGRLCLRLNTTPADSITMSGTMVIEEIG